MSASSHNGDRVIGIKQSKKIISQDKARYVFVARDAERRVIGPFLELCRQKDIEIVWVDTMQKLGDACAIDVGASVVTVLK